MIRTAIPRRMPKPVQPDQAAREYMRLLDTYTKAYEQLMREGLAELLPELKVVAAEERPAILDSQKASRTDAIRMDTNIEKAIRALFAKVSKQLSVRFPDKLLTRWGLSMVNNVNRLAKRNMTQVAEKVDLEIEPLMGDQGLNPYFKNVIEENVGLIKSIPERQMPTFKNQLVSALTADTPQDQIRAMIEKNFGKSYDAARLIARDQTNKLNGAIDEYRQKSIGVSRYYWRRNRDGRCRPEHEKLGAASDNGKLYSWSNPPLVDAKTGRRAHPKGDFQCRCWAEAYLGDVVQ